MTNTFKDDSRSKALMNAMDLMNAALEAERHRIYNNHPRSLYIYI